MKLPIDSSRFSRDRQCGLSLIELMVALTIGLFLLAGMIAIFLSSSQSHNELEKASRQIESGRYSIEMLRDDIELAAFFGDLMPAQSVIWATPDICATATASLGFVGVGALSLPTGIFGYESADALPSSCNPVVTNRRAGTDVLVIRRVSTEVTAVANVVAGEQYLQVSNCSDAPVEPRYVLGDKQADFVLHAIRPNPSTCRNGDLNPPRKYVVRIFFVADCNVCNPSDGIPTLKMAELVGGSFTVRSIAEGVENVQFEYGIDTSGADGVPDSYVLASGVANWQDVVAAKAFVLARNTERTTGYSDTKTYVLSSDGSNTVSGGGDQFRRHVYSVAVRANNISGRRQQ
jgi:type IV pilus assembly protein PilW